MMEMFYVSDEQGLELCVIRESPFYLGLCYGFSELFPCRFWTYFLIMRLDIL